MQRPGAGWKFQGTLQAGRKWWGMQGEPGVQKFLPGGGRVEMPQQAGRLVSISSMLFEEQWEGTVVCPRKG